MLQSTVNRRGQTTLPRDVRAALGLTPGDRVRYIILDDGVRLLKVRPVIELAGSLQRVRANVVSLEAMDEFVGTGGEKAGRGADR